MSKSLRIYKGIKIEPIIVTPPLHGEYIAITSPGDKIPSHGTHKWGMTYAYDFIQVKKNNYGTDSWHRKSFIQYLLCQVKLSDTYGWGQPIYSPINGIVREVFDSVKERKYLHLFSDIGLIFFNNIFFSYTHSQIQTLSGNYLIIEGENYCAFIAHAKFGSIRPKVGDRICSGDFIAELGHSGNSSVPHLHFQLMDCADIRLAKGIPCSFASYEVECNGSWQTVTNSIPNKTEKIRFNHK